MVLWRRLVAIGLRTGGDVREAAEQDVGLAELVGRPGDLADGYLSLAFHYVIRGPRVVGLLLLDAAADIARTNRDGRLLTRVLANLNAMWTHDDADRAVAIGNESLATARQVGDVYWIRTSVMNLKLALLAQGEWDDAMALGDDGTPFARVYSLFVEAAIADARGEAEILGRPHPFGAQDRDDQTVDALKWLLDAMARLQEGGADAGRLAQRGLELILEQGGLLDDFASGYAVATSVAWACGDRVALASMMELVHRERDTMPTGLRALHARMQALVAAADGASPDEVEHHFRTALREAEAWHSRPTVARVQGDLGRWLRQQGREQEAEPLLLSARAEFERLRATAWSRELDESMAGATP